jgi:putative membrane protein
MSCLSGRLSQRTRATLSPWQAWIVAVALLMLSTCPATAHAIRPGLQPWWSTWSADPIVWGSLIVCLALYVRGLSHIWLRVGVGRGVSRLQVWSFFAACLSLLIALISPLDALSDDLLSAHMVQHMVLILIAAPLFAVSAPVAPLLLGIPAPVRPAAIRAVKTASLRTAARVLTVPLVALVVQSAVFWVWHLPLFFDAAVGNDVIHALEHALFLATAWLFWCAVLLQNRARRVNEGTAALIVVAAGLQSGMLGALMTFSAAPWYPVYNRSVSRLQLPPLQDQQMAGLVMWIPGGFVYLAVVLILAARWLNSEARRARPSPARAETEQYAAHLVGVNSPGHGDVPV